MSAAPEYERVAESIREEIRTGDLAPGTKLPGNRPLADQYGVSLGTAQKAVQVLREQRWLTATPSVGVFANEPPDETTERETLEAVRRRVDELATALSDLAGRVEQIESASDAR